MVEALIWKLLLAFLRVSSNLRGADAIESVKFSIVNAYEYAKLPVHCSASASASRAKLMVEAT
jgi:hypothetical protein